MSTSTTHSQIPLSVLSETGLSRVFAMCKQFLNDAGALASRPAERRRFAALTPHLLDDIGMTVAERDALLR